MNTKNKNLFFNESDDETVIVTIAPETREEFDVEIPTVEIIPSNFNSAKKIYELIERLKEE